MLILSLPMSGLLVEAAGSPRTGLFVGVALGVLGVALGAMLGLLTMMTALLGVALAGSGLA